MNDNDSEYIERRAAYVDTIRGLHKGKRTAGFVGCLVGVVILGWGRLTLEAPSWATPLGLGVIAVSWLVFAYVIYARTRYVRTHPFDPGS